METSQQLERTHGRRLTTELGKKHRQNSQLPGNDCAKISSGKKHCEEWYNKY